MGDGSPGSGGGEPFPREPFPPETPDGTPGAEPDAKPRGKKRLLALIALSVVGLAVLGGGIAGAVWAYTRQPTPDQVAAAGDRLSAQEWRTLTAGQIFPATVSYTDTLGRRTKATLVGIAPQASCATGFDAAAARVLDKAGCLTVLRATYADVSGAVLDTVGTAVMTSVAAANAADDDLGPGATTGLLPVSFPGTIAGGFTRQARELTGLQVAGRYLVASAAGYADGRKTADGTSSGESGPADLSGNVADAVGNVLGSPSSPCANQEIRC
jgi:hypothetical protein